jgi:hypothetical protein
MSDITKLPILTSATDGTYILTVDNGTAKRLPFPGAGQLRGNIGYTGSFGYTGSRGVASTVPGYVGSKGFAGSTGFIGSSGASVYQGFTGSTGTQGVPGPGNVIIASTLSVFTPASSAVEYIIGVQGAGSNQTPIISTVNPVVFNTRLGHVGIGTTATSGTLHLKSTTSTAIFLEVANTSTKHQLISSPVGNLSLDIDTTNASGGSNFYIKQAGASKITLLPNGNVGITTDQPADTLDVSGILRVSSNNIISKSYGRYYTEDNSRVYLEYQRYAATTSDLDNTLYGGIRIVADIDHPEIGGVFSFDNTQVSHLESQNWQQRMTIIENGYVGINTPRPGALLTVSKNSTSTIFVPPQDPANTTLYLVGANASYNRLWMESFGSGGNAVNVKVSGGTAQAPTATPAGYIWFVSAAGRGTTTNLGVGQARMGIGAESTFTDAYAPTYIFFQTTGGAERLRIDSLGRVQTAGAIDGGADINIRNTATNSASGSLSLTASPAGGDGTSYIIMGNSNGAGSLGPVIVQSSNRQFQIGTGTSFSSRVGGTFFRNFSIDVNGNGDIYGNWMIDGGVDPSATMSTIKTTFNLVDTTATTVNFAGAATQINMGNATAATILTRPGTIVGSNSTQNLYDTVAATMNFSGASTQINMGNATNATILTRPGTIVGANATQNLYDTVATTMNFSGAATQINMGNATAATILTRPGTIVGSNATQNLYDTSPTTTLNLAGNATQINMGNDTAATILTRPGTIVGFNAIQNLYNTVATTMNFAGAATSLNMGSQIDGSIATISNPTVVGARAEQWLWDTVATTVHAFGNASSITIGTNNNGNVTTNIRTMLKLTYSGNTDSVLQIVGTDTKGGLGFHDFLHVQNTAGGAVTPNKFFRLDNVGSLQIVDSAYSNVLLQLKDNGDLNVHGSNITSDQTTVNLINATATTGNLFGLASTVNIGAASGTLTLNNPTVVGNAGVSTVNLWNTVATTVNAFGNATAITIGNNTGLTTIRHDLRVTGDLYVNGSNTIVNSTNIQTGDKIFYLSTTSVNAGLAVNSGIAIGPVSGPYATWEFDGSNTWVTPNNIQAASYYDTSLTAGQVVYPDSHQQLVGSANLFWNATNNRLGINTNTPSYDLDVNGDFRATGVIYAKTTLNSGLYLQGGNDAAFYDINTANTTAIQGIQDSTVGSLKLGSGGGIISGKSSRIGIAQTNPSYTFDVNGDIHGTNIYDDNLTSGRVTYAGASGKLQDSSGLTFDGTTLTVSNDVRIDGKLYFKSSSDNTDPFYVTKNDVAGDLSILDVFIGDNGAGTSISQPSSGVTDYMALRTADANIHHLFGSDGTYTSGGNVWVNGQLDALTPNNGTTGGVRIHGNSTSGFARLQITDAAGTSEWASLKINSGGQWQFNNDISSVGNVIGYFSDERLKTQLGPIENAVDKVKSLTGFYYEVNETAQALGYKVKREIGVSAQAVERILPEIVSPAPVDNQYLTIDYAKLTPLLIEAVKEQQATIDQMAADIALLKSKLGL